MTTLRLTSPNPGSGDRSAAAVRVWVGWYTARLPPEIAAARRDLIDADLWDEAHAAQGLGVTRELGRQRVSRLVRGIPADLTWRLGQSRANRNATGRGTMRISRRETVVLASVGALYGAGLVAALMTLTGVDPERWGGWGPYGLSAALALCVAGLIVAFPRPAVGLALTVAGALVGLFAMPWAWFLLLPVPIAAWYRLSRSRSLTSRPTSPAEGSTGRPA